MRMMTCQVLVLGQTPEVLQPSAHLSDRSTSSGSGQLRTASPIGALAPGPGCLRSKKPNPRITSDSDPVSPTGVHRKPCSSLFSDWRARIDWGHPTGNARSERTRRRTKEGKTGLASQTTVPGTIPCETILYNRPATNSIVVANNYLYSIIGASQNTRTVRPPMCLWASIVLWAPKFTVPGECGKAMPPVGKTAFL